MTDKTKLYTLKARLAALEAALYLDEIKGGPGSGRRPKDAPPQPKAPPPRPADEDEDEESDDETAGIEKQAMRKKAKAQRDAARDSQDAARTQDAAGMIAAQRKKRGAIQQADIEKERAIEDKETMEKRKKEAVMVFRRK